MTRDTSRVMEIIYPEADGKPLGETDLHIDLILEGKDVLRRFFEKRSDVYVAGNNFIYYVEEDPKKRVSPDLYVVFGVSPRKRNSYKTWEEGGKGPAVVFEFTSRKTKGEDSGSKRDLYESVLRIPEYFLFDPRSEWLRPRLTGYRLINGQYIELVPQDGRLYSEQLALEIVPDGQNLRYFDPDTRSLLGTSQQIAVRVADAEQRAAREAEARAAAERRAEAAEEEIARLRAVLERRDRPESV